jgi:hypothetical protein
MAGVGFRCLVRDRQAALAVPWQAKATRRVVHANDDLTVSHVR